ncbi:MAG: hypothetical protein GXO92_00620 [FCB group bacterium]|nr:hypothetical protein [FCB group bacterium]
MPIPVSHSIKKILMILMILAFYSLAGQDKKLEEPFDSNTLNDPEPHWPVVVNPLIKGPDLKPEESKSDTSKIVINGYRVQVLATKYAEKADSLKQVLRESFGNEVYVTYEAPNYKVRVGNSIDRKQAEGIQNKLKKMGYSSAWIIRTRVEVKSASIHD